MFSSSARAVIIYIKNPRTFIKHTGILQTGNINQKIQSYPLPPRFLIPRSGFPRTANDRDN